MPVIEVDNLIIGAGLVGALTARTLADQGQRGVLLERSSDAGGVNGSFQDSLGNWFDYGRHVIHSDRSEFTRSYITDLMDDNLHHFDLERSIVVRGQLIPYASGLDSWPSDLRKKIQLDTSVPILLGSERGEFARAYGDWFANLVFDEMLEAYPSLRWQRQRGIPESHLMRWIFPWFFPRTANEVEPAPGSEVNVYSEESRDYHYRTRHSNPPVEKSMYPKESGFAGIIQALLSESQASFELQLGVSQLDLELEPEALTVSRVSTAENHYMAKRVFWCAPLPALCRYFDWSLPRGEAQWEILGSFTFQDPVNMSEHEILFADPAYRIRRINNPGKIAGQSASCTLQVEYTTLGEEVQEHADSWQESWHSNLRELGLVDEKNRLLEFDLKKVPRGVVTTEDLDVFLETCTKHLRQGKGNLVTPHLAVASDNNCRLIPEVHHFIHSVLATT